MTPEIIPIDPICGSSASVRGFQSALDSAFWHTEVGIYTVPVPIRKKFPRLKAWQLLRILAIGIPAYFNGKPQNVGGLLGISSNGTCGLADVDQDSREALALASFFLPATTMIYGRASKPASHYLYYSDPPVRLEQFRDPLTKTMLLELRGLKKTDGNVGLQTILPGSEHASGELITFESGHDSGPSRVAATHLISTVRKLAAASLLCRYWPDHGRHAAMLAVSGALARCHWSREDALAFCHAIYEAVPTHDPTALARVNAEVNDSYDKVAMGEPATGFPSLTDHIDKRVVRTAFNWLGIEWKGAPRITTPGIVDNWREQLLVSETGVIKPLLANVLVVLRNDPKYQGLIAYNQFALTTFLQRQPQWSPQAKPKSIWTDFDDSQLTAQLQQDGIAVNTRIAAEAAATVAQENPFHPVRSYLDTRVWDVKQRADSWLAVFFGAENNAYTSAVGKCFLISAVARIYQPGCKVDQILLLEGPQGSLKSTGLRILAGDEWFSDHISDLGSKDSRLEVAGTWIFELAELDRVRRGEVSRVKAFVTAQIDVFRPPYGRSTQRFPRSCVFAATANDTTTLVDETGNRRWWPIRCGHIDIDALARDRDQLWAEAVALFKAGEKWWLTSPELNKAAAREAEERYQAGIWDEQILNWCDHPEPREKRADDHIEGSLPFDSKPFKVTITDILLHCIGKPFDKMAHADLMQVQRCLVHNGWRRLPQSRVSGTARRVRFYELPTPIAAENPRGSL